MKSRMLLSLVQADGTLLVYADEVDIESPGADDVIVRVDASPIHPSNLHSLIASADLDTFETSNSRQRPELKARIPMEKLAKLAARIGKPLPTGNEGAGLVIDAGRNATHLVGKTVACLRQGMFAEYICVPARACHVLPDDVTAVEGAASLVNPLTALGMIELMRDEGHQALVHTAAASSLGQMLNRICLRDDIPLINVVRRREQAELLHRQGARHVCVSGEDDFDDKLVEALDTTQATIAFDAVGGGPLIGQLLDGMETAALRRQSQYSHYGSMIPKSIYVYGSLDDRPIEFRRRFEFSWKVSGWLISSLLAKLSEQHLAALWNRISSQLTTTFATRYAARLSLDEMLTPLHVQQYAQMATGQKFLIVPHP